MAMIGARQAVQASLGHHADSVGRVAADVQDHRGLDLGGQPLVKGQQKIPIGGGGEVHNGVVRCNHLQQRHLQRCRFL